jgi:hypothetical protein
VRDHGEGAFQIGELDEPQDNGWRLGQQQQRAQVAGMASEDDQRAQAAGVDEGDSGEVDDDRIGVNVEDVVDVVTQVRSGGEIKLACDGDHYGTVRILTREL